MKVTKRLSVLLLSVIMVLGVAGMQASAAETASQDGVQVTLTTDKQEYTKNDKINATLTVTNNNSNAVTDVNMEAFAPDGFKVAANTPAVKTAESIAPGETVEHNVTYVVSSITSPATGSSSNLAAIIALSLTIGVAGAVAVKAKKEKQFLSMFMAVAVVGSVIAAAPVKVSAEETNRHAVQVDKTVVFDSKNVVIKETVTYTPAAAPAETNGIGHVSGKVVKASDRTTPIANAEVKIYQGDQLVDTVKTDADGGYNKDLMNGDYRFEVEEDGFIKFVSYVHVDNDQTTYLETFLLIEGGENEKGIASGNITDALNGQGLEGVTLDIRKDWNNASIGDVVMTVTTDASGNYSAELPIGNYTMLASKEGYVSAMINIIAQPGETGNQNGSITPILSGSDYRVVLTWGQNPRDVDSHMVGKLSDGYDFHVYFSRKYAKDGDIEVCNLDVDDMYSYGPETITLHANSSEPYYYFVHHWRGTGTLATSNAKVELYQGENLISTFNVPTNQECGDRWYWNVFALKDGNLIINNTLTESPNIEYAN